MPVRDNPVPVAEYVVSVFIELIPKEGYVPVMVVAPEPVNATIWSGASFLKIVPVNDNPVPAVYVVSVSVKSNIVLSNFVKVSTFGVLISQFFKYVVGISPLIPCSPFIDSPIGPKQTFFKFPPFVNNLASK